MTVEEFESLEEKLLLLIHPRLKEDNYRFKPAEGADPEGRDFQDAQVGHTSNNG